MLGSGTYLLFVWGSQIRSTGRIFPLFGLGEGTFGEGNFFRCYDKLQYCKSYE